MTSKEPRTVEVLSPAGIVISRFQGFAQLKSGDHFRVLNEDGEPSPVWLALGDPYRVGKRTALAIMAREIREARPLLRS